MRALTITLGLAVLAWGLFLGWQVGSREVANVLLQDDMQDIASQLGTRIGLAQYGTDEDLRVAVIRKAKRYDIELTQKQVLVRHLGSGNTSTVYLIADYSVPVSMPGYSFTLHFTPSTTKKLLLWRTQ